MDAPKIRIHFMAKKKPAPLAPALILGWGKYDLPFPNVRERAMGLGFLKIKVIMRTATL